MSGMGVGVASATDAGAGVGVTAATLMLTVAALLAAEPSVSYLRVAHHRSACKVLLRFTNRINPTAIKIPETGTEAINIQLFSADCQKALVL